MAPAQAQAQRYGTTDAAASGPTLCNPYGVTVATLQRSNAATYFQLNVLHYSSGETVLAKAWVRKMRSREPEVRIDIDAMNLIANIQAQTYYSNAIEAHLLNKPHPGLRTEPTPAV